MGNQETFPRTELACAVMIFSTPNSQHPTPNVTLPELNSRRRELRVDCTVAEYLSLFCVSNVRDSINRSARWAERDFLKGNSKYRVKVL
jgi:hypothetical protein